MELTQAYQEMIKVHGWNGTAATLGLTRTSLESRVYEVKGMGMRVSTAMLLQNYSETKCFAEAIAAASGGVFMELPAADDLNPEALDESFHLLCETLGDLSKTYRAAAKDGEIDKRERADLEGIANDMHSTVKKLMHVMFKVYCKPEAV